MKHSLVVLLTLLSVAARSHSALAQTRTHELKLLPQNVHWGYYDCLLYTSPSPRDRQKSRMPSSA